MCKDRPNLLFILVDQMRACAMGCAGNSQIQTPHLDQLASEGIVFEHAVSNIPICTPARACLLTGRYPLSNTVLTNNSLLPNDMPSVGKLLKAAGYHTGYIGKWHLAGQAFIGATEANNGMDGWIPPGPMRHGFDFWAVHHCSHDYLNACYYRDTPEPIRIDGWEPDVQTDLALGFVRNQTRGQAAQSDPFALFLSWGTPHTPFIAPSEYVQMHDPAALTLRANVAFPENGYTRSDSVAPPESNGDPENILRHWTANYYGAISNIDYNVGRLLAELERLGLRDDTVVVFTSDHGEMLGSHGQLHKLQPWDESILVPLLMRFPQTIACGRRTGMVFNQPDMLPSLFGLMGLDVPEGVEGEDLSPILRGEMPEKERSGFLVWPCSAVTWGRKWGDGSLGGRGMPDGFLRPYRGIRTRTHTYVRDRSGPWFLYDNINDPWQLRNLAEEPGIPIPGELEDELDQWLVRTDDLFEDTSYYKEQVDVNTGLCVHPEALKRH